MTINKRLIILIATEISVPESKNCPINGNMVKITKATTELNIGDNVVTAPEQIPATTKARKT